MSAKLTAVGLGPGDPELMTIKGLRAIQTAQVIFVPRSRDGEKSLALRIAQPWLDLERQQLVELLLPMTRNAAELLPAWQAAAGQIADYFEALIQTDVLQEPTATLKNKDSHRINPLPLTKQSVQGVYLLLGDPLLYGTFTYIWAELKSRYPQIEIEIIPGVTSFAAVAALAQMPLSATSDRVAILPASYETDAVQLRRLLTDFETVILMKVGPVLPQILTALEEIDLLDAAVYAERVGMPEERIVIGQELRAMQNQRRPYLSLLIVRRER